jgi:hypothetical protein
LKGAFSSKRDGKEALHHMNPAKMLKREGGDFWGLDWGESWYSKGMHDARD